MSTIKCHLIYLEFDRNSNFAVGYKFTLTDQISFTNNINFWVYTADLKNMNICVCSVIKLTKYMHILESWTKIILGNAK